MQPIYINNNLIQDVTYESEMGIFKTYAENIDITEEINKAIIIEIPFINNHSEIEYKSFRVSHLVKKEGNNSKCSLEFKQIVMTFLCKETSLSNQLQNKMNNGYLLVSGSQPINIKIIIKDNVINIGSPQ